MIYIQTHSTDPTWNLALEEYAQKSLTQFPEIFMLWQNDNAIIVGKYQNMAREINLEAAREKNVRVVRRSTGGGTVYHDLGNLNFSLISFCDTPETLDKMTLSDRIIQALKKMEIPVELSGRNDILLNGKKISGTAQSYSHQRLLHHGTLLFDSNINVLADVLNVDQTKLQSKGISSVKSRVTNIKTELGLAMTMSEFWNSLKEHICPFEEYILTEKDLDEVKELQKNKYAAWDWNVGAEPKFSFSNEQRFPAGLLTLKYNVEQGKLTKCNISGDFLGLTDICRLESALTGISFSPNDVKAVLLSLPLNMFIGGISADEFLECMFKEAIL